MRKAMGSRFWLSHWIAFSLAGCISASLFCQPRLVLDQPSSYQVGDKVDLGSILEDSSGAGHRLGDLIQPDARVLVLIIFGGGLKSFPDEEKFRGPLWCEDSFDDLAVQRALVSRFHEEPVQFFAVAVPPVYKPETFGWERDPFLSLPDDSEDYRQAVEQFIQATEKEKARGLLPFDTVYYDPRFRLAQNKKERELGEQFGTIYDWQGKLKWHNDPRRYGTPTIWILGRDGEVLVEPLYGNDYDSDPPEIHYGYAEASALIEHAIQRQG